LDKEYSSRLVLITLVFYLTIILAGKTNLNTALLLANTLSIIITIAIWYKDKILKIEIKWKTLAYYLTLLIGSAIIFPRDITTITSILYRNGFREEVLYRFFMVGIFLKYGYTDTDETKKILYAVLYSNILFMMGHGYDLIGLFYIFIIGTIFSLIYLKGGLPSVIIAHTLHNLYRSREHTLLILLLLVPLIVEHDIVKKLRK